MNTSHQSQDTPPLRRRRVLWVIYERPRDFPDSYVVRKWHFDLSVNCFWPEVPVIAIEQNAEAARAHIPPGCQKLQGPELTNDPVVLEVWE